MEKHALVFPVLPGKDARIPGEAFKERSQEYRESRERLGIHLERAYEMQTPMGSFVIACIESDHGFGETLAAMASSTLEIDRFFLEQVKDIHGVDVTQPPRSDPPELLADWVDDATSARKRGLAFCAPVMPGAEDRGRAFAKEAWGTRVDELAESRRALGITRELVMLNHTPNGDVVAVYLEGDDPADGNRRFAESQSEFDVWFKEQCKTVFPPEIDFNVPLPPIVELFDSQGALVAS